MLGKKSGFGFYVKNLVENLKKIDTQNEYFLIDSGKNKDLRTYERIWWDQVKFVKKVKLIKPDVVHKTCFSVPKFGNFKKVVTIHDIIPILYPENFSMSSRFYFTKLMPWSYKFADYIITISESAKKDLVEKLGLDENKIKVIYEAAGSEFRVITDLNRIEEVKKKYGISGNYILNVGTLEPRKNLEFLVNVFNDIRKLRYSDIGDLKLVIAGKKGWRYENIFLLIKELNLQDKVIFTDYVEEGDLPYLYNGAKLFAFPSIYEGFGLPILEAMKCGVPVISSNSSSLPEVVGDAGILIDPKNKEVWVKNIIEVLKSPEKQIMMKADGLKQADKFSWKKCAEETLEVYNELKIID
jgi:glycosyltransferase involved in cell wall biosynthesis